MSFLKIFYNSFKNISKYNIEISLYFCKEFQSNVFNTITYIGGVQ